LTGFWHAAWRSLLPALGGLLCACVLCVALLTLYLSWPIRADGVALSVALRMCAWAFLVGIIPTLLYAVPLYALAILRGAASYRSALLIGAVPGAVIVPIDPITGFLVMLFCISVALFTHAIAMAARRPTPSVPAEQ
jgi:hypothetical protein